MEPALRRSRRLGSRSGKEQSEVDEVTPVKRGSERKSQSHTLPKKTKRNSGSRVDQASVDDEGGAAVAEEMHLRADEQAAVAPVTVGVSAAQALAGHKQTLEKMLSGAKPSTEIIKGYLDGHRLKKHEHPVFQKAWTLVERAGQRRSVATTKRLTAPKRQQATVASPPGITTETHAMIKDVELCAAATTDTYRKAMLETYASRIQDILRALPLPTGDDLEASDDWSKAQMKIQEMAADRSQRFYHRSKDFLQGWKEKFGGWYPRTPAEQADGYFLANNQLIQLLMVYNADEFESYHPGSQGAAAAAATQLQAALRKTRAVCDDCGIERQPKWGMPHQGRIGRWCRLCAQTHEGVVHETAITSCRPSLSLPTPNTDICAFYLFSIDHSFAQQGRLSECMHGLGAVDVRNTKCADCGVFQPKFGAWHLPV